MMKAQINVIIPAYNQADYLTESIQSVLDQTFGAFELVVVDDGSTDRTREVAHSFSDPRIRYIYQENKGLSGARNTGIQQSDAPYLLFLDADDRLLPHCLELHAKNLESETGTGMSVGGWILCDDRGKHLPNNVFPPASLSPASLLNGNPFPVHSVLSKRSWFEKAGLFDESLNACEDWDLWLRFIMSGCKVSFLNEIMCVYRMHSGQMTRQAIRMKTAMLTVLKKTFSNPALPEDWKPLQEKAFAAAFVKAAAREYYAGLDMDARQDLERAVSLDPGLREGQAHQLADLLAGWADAPMVDDPLDFLERVYQKLPENLSVLKRRYRKDLARLSMQMAFRYHQNRDLSKARYFILRAVRYQPTRLKNRGVLSILVQSYIHL